MQTIKYGVIGVKTLLRDFGTWDTLQVAGRLHKPVQHIITDPAVMAAIDTNLQSALAASLLTLPQAFTTAVRPPFLHFIVSTYDNLQYLSVSLACPGSGLGLSNAF